MSFVALEVGVLHHVDPAPGFLDAPGQVESVVRAAPLDPVGCPDDQDREHAPVHVLYHLVQHRVLLSLAGALAAQCVGLPDHVAVVLAPLIDVGHLVSLVLRARADPEPPGRAVSHRHHLAETLTLWGLCNARRLADGRLLKCKDIKALYHRVEKDTKRASDPR
jgi:hypothetical protein